MTDSLRDAVTTIRALTSENERLRALVEAAFQEGWIVSRDYGKLALPPEFYDAWQQSDARANLSPWGMVDAALPDAFEIRLTELPPPAPTKQSPGAA